MKPFSPRRVLRGLFRLAAVLIGLPALALALALLFAAAPGGKRAIAALVTRLSGGDVAITGLTGHLFADLRIRRLRLSDGSGVWLAIDDLALSWRPAALLTGILRINRLEARRIRLARLPAASPAASPTASPAAPSSGPPHLPFALDLRQFAIARLDLAPGVIGPGLALRITGQARLSRAAEGEAALDLTRLDHPGSARLRLTRNRAGLGVRLTAADPAPGLPIPGPLALTLRLSGAPAALHTTGQLSLGAADLRLHGTLDLAAGRADLALVGKTGGVALAGLTWAAAEVSGRIAGTLGDPAAILAARFAGLSAAGVTLPVLDAALRLKGIVPPRVRLALTLPDAAAPGSPAPGSAPRRRAGSATGWRSAGRRRCPMPHGCSPRSTVI